MYLKLDVILCYVWCNIYIKIYNKEIIQKLFLKKKVLLL